MALVIGNFALGAVLVTVVDYRALLLVEAAVIAVAALWLLYKGVASSTSVPNGSRT